MSEPTRPTWTAYFLALASLAASRSTCLRRQVGAVLVIDNHVVATGYNGAPSGSAHCLKIGCIRQQQNIPSGERLDICRAAHAEANAIAQAARFGVPVGGSTMYCTTFPCRSCARSIVNAGIVRIVYRDGYPDDESAAILSAARVEAVQA